MGSAYRKFFKDFRAMRVICVAALFFLLPAFAVTGYRVIVAGVPVDIDTLFAPVSDGGGGSSCGPTGIKLSDGSDLGDRFAAASRGVAYGPVGFRSNSGTDLGNLCARAGSVLPPPPPPPSVCTFNDTGIFPVGSVCPVNPSGLGNCPVSAGPFTVTGVWFGTSCNLISYTDGTCTTPDGVVDNQIFDRNIPTVGNYVLGGRPAVNCNYGACETCFNADGGWFKTSCASNPATTRACYYSY